MPDLAVFLFACMTSCALAVDLQVFPAAEEMPPMMTPTETNRANSVLTELGLTPWFACPLAGYVTNMMVTLADGYTYDRDRVAASCRNTNTLKSPHYRHLTIPTSLAFAFVNLDLMDIAKNAELIAQSVFHRVVPATIRPWVGPGSPLRQPIFICADGRSRLMTSFQRPFTIEQLGMLVLDSGDFCFRNIRLEEVVEEVCRRVDCGTDDVPHIRRTSTSLGTVHVEPDAHQTLSTSSQLFPTTVASSSRPSVASRHRQCIDTSSTGTPTAIHQSQTSTASSSSGSSPPANRRQPIALMSPDAGSDGAASITGADIADAIPWPSASVVKPTPSLPSGMSSAWAATIAHTRDLEKAFWSRHNLCSSHDNFYAALFWAHQYRTTFKPANMELPPKPTNPCDLRSWQASCHRFFQAAEDIVVNAMLEKRGNPQGDGQGIGRRVCRHSAVRLRNLVTLLGLVPKGTRLRRKPYS